MKYNYSNFLYLFIATILFSCTPKQTTDKKSDDSSHPYTTSYKAPVFENDNRIEKIQKLAPELQTINRGTRQEKQHTRYCIWYCGRQSIGDCIIHRIYKS